MKKRVSGARAWGWREAADGFEFAAQSAPRPMSSLLDQLIREHGEEVAGRIAERLGIPREEAAKALPAAASVVLERFDPGLRTDRGDRVGAAASSLDGLLGGTGEQVSERVGNRLGISSEQAARLVPILLPVILGFLVRRVPYGGAALSLLTATVEKQGHGSLDELAVRMVQRLLPKPDPSGRPAPSLATRLGRLAGKWFPSEQD